MGSSLPKQFLELNGLPVIMRSAMVFLDAYPDIRLILVIPEGYFSLWDEYVHRYHFRHRHKLAVGGETRFHSVKSGLQLVQPDEVVAIHDAARPLISKDLVERCFLLAEEKGSAVPVITLPDSIRQIGPEKSIALNRDEYRLVQTPQVFRAEYLHQAYENDYASHHTDDATLVGEAGFEIFLLEGEKNNLKITEPFDLWLASEYLRKKPE